MPPGGLHQREVLVLGDVLAALEHHVLEQVREAGLAPLLVLAADVVPEVDRHDRCGPIRRDHDAQAVRQPMALEADLRHAFLRNRCDGRARGGHPRVPAA